MNTGVIYALHFGKKKRYIGSTDQIYHRINAHWSLLAKGRHHSRALQNAVNKYGLDNLLIEIVLETVPLNRLLQEEQKLLDTYKGFTYNCSPTAASRRGCKERPETRAKRSLLLRGNQLRRGIPHDKKTKDAISRKLRELYVDGSRKRPVGARTLDQYWDEVRTGKRPHPTRRSIAQIIEVLTDLATTRSVRKTGARLGMNKENVRSILKQATFTLEDAAGPSLRQKHNRGFFIHPDWFDVLQEVAA